MALPEWLRQILITLAAKRLVRVTRKTLRRGTVREIQACASAYRELATSYPAIATEANGIAEKIEDGYGLGSIEAFVLEREGVIDRDKGEA
jgi:hypothetical protein